MNILIACEWSGRVRDAFRHRGHSAYSCDIEPSAGEFPEYHINDDVREHLIGWDMIIAFPPCDYLTRANGSAYGTNHQANAIDFVRYIWEADCPRIAVENPPGALSRALRKPDQIIQPWGFGDPWTKATCLWLKGLEPLVYTDPVPSMAHSFTDSYKNKKRRSITFQGIADAMAEQWG